MNYLRRDLLERLADDYVMGSLRGAARQRFDRLQLMHPEVAAARREAESRWHPLSEALPPMQPSADSWREIQRRTQPTTRQRESRFGSLALWRGLAAFSVLALVAVLSFQVLQPPNPGYVVVITKDADEAAGWLVSLQDQGQQVKVESLAPQPLPPGKVHQLWVKVPDRERVTSVGLITNQGDTTLRTGAELRALLGKAILFGVSVEPAGGSPTGQPTEGALYHGVPRAI